MRKPAWSILVIIFTGALCAKAQPGALDLSFDPQPGLTITSPFDDIKAMALQPDGKILAGGHFFNYAGIPSNYLVRLHNNGILDTTFHTAINSAGWAVRALVVQPDRKIIVGGDFSTATPLPTDNIVRLNIDGSVDTSFYNGPVGFNSTVFTLALQSDGKIVAGGLFTEYNGAACNHLARLNADGRLDTTFDTHTGANASVEVLKVLQDGKIVIGGDFTTYWGDPIMRVARVNANGSRDSSFTALPGASSVIKAVESQPNGSVLIGGNFSQYDFQPRSKLARTLDNGGLDPQFYVWQGASSEVQDIKLASSGCAIVVGGFSNFQDRTVNRIVLVDSFSKADTTFNYGGISANNTIIKVITDAQGKILISGAFTSYNNRPRLFIARLYNCLTASPDSIYGDINAACNGATQTYYVTPVAGATKYQWTLPSGWTGSSDSASITAISNGTGGVITVKAFTDSCGYSYATSRVIATIQPPVVPICLVTVDTQSTHNIIMWEKPRTATIDSFFIYRETSTNVYTKVGAVAYDSLSEYHDYGANPNTTSYRYKLSVLDTCGAESEKSPYHSTIHLQNLGTGNFQWTFYQIENALNPVIEFNVYRDNLDNGNFFQIGTVPGTNATFTDINFAAADSHAIYVLDTRWGISCEPTRAVSTTRSNIRPKGLIDRNPTLNLQDNLAAGLRVYPNPASKIIFVSLPVPVEQLQLINAMGQAVIKQTIATESNQSIHQLDVSKLAPGIYSLSVETETGKVIKKVVVQ